MARKPTDQHADVVVEGPQPYDPCQALGYETNWDQPGYERSVKIRPGQTIDQAKREEDERYKQMMQGMVPSPSIGKRRK